MDIKHRNYQSSNTCPVPVLASIGCISTLLSELLTYPFEYAKTKIQMNGTQGCEKYKNLRNLIATKSMKQFYRGFNAHLLKMIPFSTTKVFAYEFLKTALTGDIVETSYLRKLSASTSACAMALITGNVGDILRIRMINSNYSIHEVIKITGLQGLFRGYWLNLITVISIQSLEIALFDKFKEFFAKNFGLQGEIVNSLVGTITGITAGLLTAPIDGYKTRYMNKLTGSYWESFANVLKEEGLLALYKGTVPYCIKLTAGSVLTLVFYEQFKKQYL